MTPKQIIYPINYISPFIASMFKSYRNIFLKKMKKTFIFKNDIIPIGRARAGIYLLVKSTISKDRSKVIMSPYTIPDLINMVRFAGGEPVFVDFLPRSTNIDISNLKDLIDAKTAAVIVTHYHVCQNNYEKIKDICVNNNVKLFEDCAISLGGAINNKPVGTESDAGVFSFSSFKFLNYYWGGAVLTEKSSLFDDLKETVGDWKELRNRDYLSQFIRTFKYDMITSKAMFIFIFRIIIFLQRNKDTLRDLSNARIESKKIDRTILSRPNNSAFYELSRKIDNVSLDLEHRRKIASIYSKLLGKYMVSSETSKDIISGSCFVNYPVYIDNGNRDFVYNKIMRMGYHVGLSLYANCHSANPFKSIEGNSENIENLVMSVITLPTHPNVSEKYAFNLASSIVEIIDSID